jgi:hypothetical protein
MITLSQRHLKNVELELERESTELREARLTLMPSGSLFRQLLPTQALPSFLRELSIRSHEEVRLILIFFG